MRIALAGKGGAGKTTISAALARLAARQGRLVVAIDADSNPNLGVALGLDPVAASEVTALPFSLVSRRVDGPALTAPVATVLEEHAVQCPDGVRLLMMGGPGHAEEGCLCSAHATVAALLGDIGAGSEALAIIDLEASPEHLSRGTVRNADVLLLVTEPYYRSLEATRRQAALASELPITRVVVLANKVRSEQDAEVVGEFCERHGMEMVAAMPWSEDALAGDRAGRSLVDAAPGGALVAALEVLSRDLCAAI